MLFTWYIIELSMDNNEDNLDQSKFKSDSNYSLNGSHTVLFKARVFKGSGDRLKSQYQESKNLSDNFMVNLKDFCLFYFQIL